MKLKMFSILMMLLLVLSSYHKYFFAFAEMEYKPNEKRLETTLIFTMHDLEASLKKKAVIFDEFERVKHDSIQLLKIENELLKDFSVSSKNEQFKFHLLDFELTNNGLINLFFEANNIELEKELVLTFKNLMADYPNQQNKLTFISNGKKSTAVFLKHKPSQKITL